MTKEQVKQYEEHGYFHVVARSGRVYALTDGYQVIEMWGGKAECSLHAFATDGYGDRLDKCDSILAQLLLLQTNENHIHAVACRNGPHHDYSYGCPPMKGDRVIKEAKDAAKDPA